MTLLPVIVDALHFLSILSRRVRCGRLFLPLPRGVSGYEITHRYARDKEKADKKERWC
jgi:hypothetical protein